MDFHGFFHIGNFMIPTDELIYFRWVGIPPSSIFSEYSISRIIPEVYYFDKLAMNILKPLIFFQYFSEYSKHCPSIARKNESVSKVMMPGGSIPSK
jgi:hypothetical protein